MILKFAKSALEPARAGSYAHRHFGAGDAVWGRNAARRDRKNTKIADIEKARKVNKSQYFVRGVVSFENV